MKPKRHDFILLGCFLLLALSCFLFYHFFPRAEGTMIQITVDGTLVKSLPLEEDTIYTIATETHTNVLQIQDGFASMIDADCPDRLCVHQHKISKEGETLICLPHKIVVSVKNSSEEAFDGIVQ